VLEKVGEKLVIILYFWRYVGTMMYRSWRAVQCVLW